MRLYTHTHTHTRISNEIANGLCTFDNESVSFFDCLNSFNKVYVKLNNIINKDSINLHYNCAF